MDGLSWGKTSEFGLGVNSGTFVIASVWLYQVLFLSNYHHKRPLTHIKETIDEARWRIAA